MTAQFTKNINFAKTMQVMIKGIDYLALLCLPDWMTGSQGNKKHLG
jgi:hypothetical protein